MAISHSEAAGVELERVAIGVRPRGGWESLDLGFQMARQWWRPLWGVWFALYVPCATIALVAFPNKFHAALLLWWLKPLFDRALLFSLSRLVFSEQTGVKETLRAARDWVRPGLLLSLSLRRLDWARSFVLPVSALEKQTGKAARQRRTVLGGRMRNNAVWLTVACLHFEAIAMLALFALGNMLVPSGGEIPLDSGSVSDGGLGFAALTSWNLADAICYAVAVSLIEPFYVAAGFSLYLNRRTILEAWDMEIRLRQLAARLRSAATAVAALVLCAILAFDVTGNTAHAAGSDNTGSGNTASDQAVSDGSGSNNIDAGAEIERILAEPDFDQYKQVTRWHSLSPERQSQRESRQPGWFWRNLVRLLSDISQALMWIAIVVLVPLLLYKLRDFLPEPRARTRQSHEPPTSLFGLNVAPESLPDDISGTARQLVSQGQLRNALSLLYRGALSVLIHRYRVVIHAGDTEGDCTKTAMSALDAAGARYFRDLVRNWQQIAYGTSAPQPEQVDMLCQGWAVHFEKAPGPARETAT
ncbi:MAG: hypothetical protein PVH05_05005 [Burkholderiales bacterium]